MAIRLLVIVAAFIYASTCHALWDSNIERLALMAARTQNNLYDYQTDVEYRALYNGQDENGCHYVTIQRNPEPKGHKPWYEHFNFRICRGMIDEISETPPETPPPGLEQVMENVAAIAFREGRGFATYGGFEIIGNTLNDKEVEIKVMKGMILYLYVISKLR